MGAAGGKGEGHGESRLGGREAFEIGRAGLHDGVEPAGGRSFPRFVGGGAGFNEEAAVVVEAGAEGGVGVEERRCVGELAEFGRRVEGDAPGVDLLLVEKGVEGGVDAGGVGEGAEDVGNGTTLLLEAVGEVLPKCPRITGRIVVGPPAGEERTVVVVAGRDGVSKAVVSQVRFVQSIVSLGEIGEQRGELADQAEFVGGEGAAQFLG